MNLAIFDLDNTLLAGDSDHAWGAYLVQQGVVSAEVHATQNDRFYQQYLAGALNIHEYVAFVTEPLQRLSFAARERLRKQFVADVITPMIAPGTATLLAQHRAQGDELIIITATNRFVTEPIAALLAIPHLIATELESDAQGYTGKIAGVPAFQDGKITRLNAWLTERDVEFTERYFYSDSHNDLPLLKNVDHPVAVDPDPTLKTIAEELGWPVITLR
ncbi:HAD family hydrolase [Salinispirillum marinum]|uniref:HAD family hydrolase n=2 Tax=Saccharospirillaceae TaxID=255527 RepID=A0ABV8BGB0_9GAMM